MADELKYEFNLSDPESWSKMPRPYLPESFIKETERIGGLNARGKPRFKWVWGMSEEIYMEGDKFIQSGWYLKYMLCTTGNRLVGFRYQTDNGTQKFVSELKDVPAGAIGMHPVYKMEQIGTPRWILEEWREEGDCNGMYDRAGYYFHRQIVDDSKPRNPETQLFPYRDPDQRDLDILAQYVKLSAELTDSDIKRGVAEDRQKEKEAAEQAASERREGLTEAIVQHVVDNPLRGIPAPSKAVRDSLAKKLEARDNL